MTRRRWWRLPDTIAPGWVVVQLFGTVFITITLATAREDGAWPWVAYAACAVCWLVFLLAGRRSPRLAATVLGAAAVFPALVNGYADDTTPVFLGAITLGRFATLVAPSVTAIVLTGVGVGAVATGSALLAGGTVERMLTMPVVLLVFLLFGLNHRQYRVQARQAGLLLEQTRLAQAESARAAALDERTRIARELHDVLAHSLGALGVQLELAEAQLAEKSDVDGALATVRRSRRLAADGLTEARGAVAALRRDVPALGDALAELAARHAEDHGGRVDFAVEGTPGPVSSAAAVSLTGTAREALTNAARHARGAPVTMRLEFAGGAVRLRVRNALAGAGQPGPGFGLTGVRERLALAGGTLSAGQDGGDWLLTAEVPGG